MASNCDSSCVPLNILNGPLNSCHVHCPCVIVSALTYSWNIFIGHICWVLTMTCLIQDLCYNWPPKCLCSVLWSQLPKSFCVFCFSAQVTWYKACETWLKNRESNSNHPRERNNMKICGKQNSLVSECLVGQFLDGYCKLKLDCIVQTFLSLYKMWFCSSVFIFSHNKSKRQAEHFCLDSINIQNAGKQSTWKNK